MLRRVTRTKTYYVYIMFGHSRRLYVGVTNDLVRRVHQHKSRTLDGFTSRYSLTQLAHYETFTNVTEAIAREKQIKGWSRDKKIQLIETTNPAWRDLADNISAPSEC